MDPRSSDVHGKLSEMRCNGVSPAPLKWDVTNVTGIQKIVKVDHLINLHNTAWHKMTWHAFEYSQLTAEIRS